VDDTGRCACSCRSLAREVRHDDGLWWLLASARMPTGFWEAVARRGSSVSVPLGTMRTELRRVVKFEAAAASLGEPAWRMDDYIAYWAFKENKENKEGGAERAQLVRLLCAPPSGTHLSCSDEACTDESEEDVDEDEETAELPDATSLRPVGKCGRRPPSCTRTRTASLSA
jgi:hypothetical protein